MSVLYSIEHMCNPSGGSSISGHPSGALSPAGYVDNFQSGNSTIPDNTGMPHKHNLSIHIDIKAMVTGKSKH